MASTNKFSSNHMLLNIEEVNIIDLFHILFSSNLKKRKFIECSQGTTVEDMTRRRVIVFSVIIQWLLKLISKPLASLGYKAEYLLNFFSANGGYFGLLSNFLRGKVVEAPERTSDKFVTILGFLDKRLDLDEKIERGDVKYGSLLAIMASKIVYQNKAFVEYVVTNHWKMEFLGFYDFWNEYQKKAKTHVLILHDKDSDLIVVAFRGTQPFDADMWSTNFDVSWYELPNIGRVHSGFMKALGLQKYHGWPKEIERSDGKPQVAYYYLRERLGQLLKENHNAKFILTGHSLGGALAILFPSILALHKEENILERLEGVYTFGQPRVGDEKFGKYVKEVFTKYGIKYFRFVYNHDVITRVPFDDSAFMFKHFETCIHFNAFYKAKILEEEPNMNYFTLCGIIPTKLSVTWEILRSFLIKYTKGKDYREGKLMRAFRMTGLVLIAGFTNHSVQDYINSIRLGSNDIYKHHK